MDKQAISELYKEYCNLKPLSSGIYKTIYASITNGYLNSGDRITIEGLADLCHASRTPVREAVRQLETDEVLAYDQRVGYYVKIYSEKDCLDLFEVLHILQLSAVKLACSTVSESYLTMLENNVNRCTEDMDPVEFFRLNSEFHIIIARSTNNIFLANAIEHLYSKLFLFDFAKHPRLNIPVSIQQHRRLIDALRNQDAQQAILIHEEHAKKTGNYLSWALDSGNATFSRTVL